MSTNGSIDKRTLILDSAEDIFAKQGYSSSTIEEIANQAGVAKGTVYLYFKSKQELFVALIEERVSSWTNLLAKELTKAKDSREVLKLAIKGHIDFIFKHAGLLNTMMHTMVSLPHDMRKRLAASKRQSQSLFAERLYEISNLKDRETAIRYVVFVNGVVNATVVYLLERKQQVDSESLAQELLEQVLFGLKFN